MAMLMNLRYKTMDSRLKDLGNDSGGVARIVIGCVASWQFFLDFVMLEYEKLKPVAAVALPKSKPTVIPVRPSAGIHATESGTKQWIPD
jgi:hypothetical protein